MARPRGNPDSSQEPEPEPVLVAKGTRMKM